MKTLKHSILISQIALACLIAGNTFGNKEEFSKTWEKTFEVNADASLLISNKYGKVHTTTWNKNVIAIKVVMTVDAGSKERAEKTLEHISISAEATKDKVEITTHIKGNLPEKINKDLHIDYTVQMPGTNNLNVKNRFGDIYVNELDGIADLRVDYGDIKCGSLNNAKNKLAVTYGNGTVTDLNSSLIVLQYAKLHIEKAKNINMDSKYSETNMGSVRKLTINSKYDQNNIEHVDVLISTAKFSGYQIGTVTKSMNIDIKYGGCEVNHISKDFKAITVNNAYGNVGLNFEKGSSFVLDAEAKMGGMDFPKNKATITKEEKGTNSMLVTALVGENKNTGSTVVINTAYGSAEVKYN